MPRPEDETDPRCLLLVHLDDGTVFEVEMATAAKTREQIVHILRNRPYPHQR